MDRITNPRNSESSERTMLQFHGRSGPQIIASLIGKLIKKIHHEVTYKYVNLHAYYTYV